MRLNEALLMYADQIDFDNFSGCGLFLDKNYVYNDTVNIKSVEISLMCKGIELCQSYGNSKWNPIGVWWIHDTNGQWCLKLWHIMMLSWNHFVCMQWYQSDNDVVLLKKNVFSKKMNNRCRIAEKMCFLKKWTKFLQAYSLLAVVSSFHKSRW